MKVSKITKVVMYRAGDGSLHESEEACEKQNASLMVAPAVKELLVNKFTVTEYDLEHSIKIFTVNDVADFVSQNSTALFEILLPLQPKKERVSRKAKDALAPALPAASAPSELPPVPGSDLNVGDSDSELLKIPGPGVALDKTTLEAV